MWFAWRFVNFLLCSQEGPSTSLFFSAARINCIQQFHQVPPVLNRSGFCPKQTRDGIALLFNCFQTILNCSKLSRPSRRQQGNLFFYFPDANERLVGFGFLILYALKANCPRIKQQAKEVHEQMKVPKVRG